MKIFQTQTEPEMIVEKPNMFSIEFWNKKINSVVKSYDEVFPRQPSEPDYKIIEGLV